MKNRRNYYRILRVQPDAPVEIIRASYRTLMLELKNHPDLGGTTFEAVILNEAYETLSDPQRRAAYDQKIKANRFKRNRTAPGPTAPPAETPPPETHVCPFCKNRLAHEVRTGKSCPTCNVPLPFYQQADRDREGHRTISRTKKNDRIVYSCTWPENPKDGTMIDLSPKGMRFFCSERLSPGTVLKISTSLLKACGRVTYQQKAEGPDNRTFATGVSFISVIFEETRGSFISVSA